MLNDLINGLVGSAGALLVAGIAWLIAKYCEHLPSKWRVGHRTFSEILMALAIIGMLLAGVEMAFGGAGLWVADILMFIRHHTGAIGGTVFTLITLGLLAAVAVHVLKSPSEKGLKLAFILPLFMATFTVGLFPSINAHLAPPAQHLTAYVSNELGA